MGLIGIMQGATPSSTLLIDHPRVFDGVGRYSTGRQRKSFACLCLTAKLPQTRRGLGFLARMLSTSDPNRGLE